MSESIIEPYAAAVRKLLQGVVYHEDGKIWQQVRDYEFPLRDYLGRIGLGIHLDTLGGFAYLYEMGRDENDQMSLPPLTQRRPLSFPVTLLLVLLRERLDEHEMRQVDQDSLRLTYEDMHEMMVVFMGDQRDARRTEQTIENSVKSLVRLGYLKEHASGDYTVRPVLRAKVDADALEDIKQKLVNYAEELAGRDSARDAFDTGEGDEVDAALAEGDNT